MLVLVFTAFYLLLFSRRASPASRERVISSVLGGSAMAYGTYALFLITAKGDSFDLYLNRSLSAKDELLSRFESQGIGALLKALDVSQGWGLGPIWATSSSAPAPRRSDRAFRASVMYRKGAAAESWPN